MYMMCSSIRERDMICVYDNMLCSRVRERDDICICCVVEERRYVYVDMLWRKREKIYV